MCVGVTWGRANNCIVYCHTTRQKATKITEKASYKLSSKYPPLPLCPSTTHAMALRPGPAKPGPSCCGAQRHACRLNLRGIRDLCLGKRGKVRRIQQIEERNFLSKWTSGIFCGKKRNRLICTWDASMIRRTSIHPHPQTDPVTELTRFLPAGAAGCRRPPARRPHAHRYWAG